MSDNFQKKMGAVSAGVAILFITGVVGLLSFRVDVPTNHVLIATALSGKDLPEGQYVATDPQSKGVLLKPYNEGVYWFNPYFYDTQIVQATIVKNGEVGVLVRLFGDDLPGNQIVATPGYDKEEGAGKVYKGILRKTLGPGKYNINTRAYDIQKFSAQRVPPGYVGVTINLADDVSPKASKNVYVEDSGKYKGVSPKVRQPGTYYLNPYCELLMLVEVRAQRFDFTKTNKADASIDFQSSDAFTLNMEGTIEWSVMPERAPELMCRVSELPLKNVAWGWVKNAARKRNRINGLMVAELKDIERKILVPYTRSYIRMLGAKYKASNYISGQRRMEIQKDFEARLKEKCNQFGIKIDNVAIRKILPPSKIKEIINDRSLQQEQRNRITQNIEKLRSDAQLREKQESIRKSQLMVDANTKAEKKRILAKQNRNVGVKKAESQLAVAKINLSKAETEKSVYVTQERARIDQEFKTKNAEIEALKQEVLAAGGGANFIRSILVRKLGQGMDDILTSDNSFFMQIFQDVLKLQSSKEQKKAIKEAVKAANDKERAANAAKKKSKKTKKKSQ